MKQKRSYQEILIPQISGNSTTFHTNKQEVVPESFEGMIYSNEMLIGNFKSVLLYDENVKLVFGTMLAENGYSFSKASFDATNGELILDWDNIPDKLKLEVVYAYKTDLKEEHIKILDCRFLLPAKILYEEDGERKEVFAKMDMAKRIVDFDEDVPEGLGNLVFDHIYYASMMDEDSFVGPSNLFEQVKDLRETAHNHVKSS